MQGLFHRRGSARSAGLVLAALVAVILAGVVGLFAWRGGPPSVPTDQSGSGPPPAPDVRLLPGGTGSLRQLGGGTKMNVTMMDRTDPARIAGELRADRSEPLENKRYRLDQPRVWVFLRDGRTLHLRAERGEALIPDTAGSRPEDGLVEGDVVLKLFAPLPGGVRPDPDAASPLMTLRTEQLRFDGRAGEITFPEVVRVTGDRADFTGRGVLIVLNEGSERLELLRVERTDELVLKPATSDRKTTASAEPAPAPAPATDAAPAPTEPTVTMYRAQCDQDVRVVQGGRSLSGQRLVGWLRLIGNALPEGALATGNPGEPAERRTAAPVVIATAFEGQPPAATPAKPADSDAPVVLTWAGPLEVRPLAEPPPELNGNDVFVRCTSDSPGGVLIGDTAMGVRGGGSMMEYGLTRKEAAIAGGRGRCVHGA